MLFGSGTDWQANACVKSIDAPMAYPDGYRRAALHLAEYVCEEGRGQDYLVYSIAYLYRHHIELTLKSIIGAAAFVIDHTSTKDDFDTLGHHDRRAVAAGKPYVESRSVSWAASLHCRRTTLRGEKITLISFTSTTQTGSGFAIRRPRQRGRRQGNSLPCPTI